MLGRRHSAELHGVTCPIFQAVLDLMKEKPEDVEAFFWDHLQKDMECLAEALSRNTEDAVLIVHLFLQQLSKHSPAGREMFCRAPAGSWWLLTKTSVMAASFLDSFHPGNWLKDSPAGREW